MRRSVSLLNELIAFPSVSRDSNVAVSEWLEARLLASGCEVERIDFLDDDDVPKRSLVAVRGRSQAAPGQGLAYLSHSDVVPADDWCGPGDNPWQLTEQNGRLYGRGSCDMKGSLACWLTALEATANVSTAGQQPAGPLYTVITADEEVGFAGAREVVARSSLFRELRQHQPRAIIGEPTLRTVVHAHKGNCVFTLSATGPAQHSGRGTDDAACWKMAAALGAINELRHQLRHDPAWQHPEFAPADLCWNLTLSSGEGAINVTAPRVTAESYIRTMPGQNMDHLLAQIAAAAEPFGVTLTRGRCAPPFYRRADHPFVQEMLAQTGHTTPRTVGFGTDAAVLGVLDNLVVCGPGDIAQAHTVDEWISLAEVDAGVDLFTQLIHSYAIGG